MELLAGINMAKLLAMLHDNFANTHIMRISLGCRDILFHVRELKIEGFRKLLIYIVFS